MSEWNKATDRLPELHEEVFEGEPFLVSEPMLVAYNNGEYLVCVYERDNDQNGLTYFEGWVSVCDGSTPATVTHWMALPDMPEREDGKQADERGETKERDNVNHPQHYTAGGIECIDAIRASLGLEEFADYCKGNVMKYVWRYRHKAGIEDLKKARVYLDWMIDAEEKAEKKAALYMA